MIKNNVSKNTGKKFSWGLVGAGASAIAASLCCVGPLLLLILGVGGSWIANLTALAPYRPVFITLTLAALGLSFYWAYQKPKTESCNTGSPCEPLGWKRSKKIILWLVTIFILGLLIFPYLVPYVFAENTPDKEVPTLRVVLEVKNMFCDACTVTVKKSLTPLKGVKEVRVTLNPPEAVVVYDPAKIKVEDLIQATTNAGFPSSAKR